MLIKDKNMDNLNLKSENSFDELLPAVLVSGFKNLVFRKSFVRRNGRTDFSYINEYNLFFFL